MTAETDKIELSEQTPLKTDTDAPTTNEHQPEGTDESTFQEETDKSKKGFKLFHFGKGHKHGKHEGGKTDEKETVETNEKSKEDDEKKKESEPKKKREEKNKEKKSSWWNQKCQKVCNNDQHPDTAQINEQGQLTYGVNLDLVFPHLHHQLRDLFGWKSSVRLSKGATDRPETHWLVNLFTFLLSNFPEPDFVVVCASEAENAERIELPTNIDGSLCVQTLRIFFPHAHGLKYKNPSTGAYRALAADISGNLFYEPECGWHNKIFIVISSQPLLASSTLQSTSDTNNKSKSTNTALVAKSESKSSVDVSNTVPFESSPTISAAAKKTQAYVAIPFHDEFDEDEALLSGSENSGDKRLRQSGGRAGFKNNYPHEHELKNKLSEIDLKIDDLHTKVETLHTKVETLLKNTDPKTKLRRLICVLLIASMATTILKAIVNFYNM